MIGLKWLAGESLLNCFYLSILFVMTSGLLMLLGEAHQSGKLAMKGGGYIYKDKNPISYRVLFVLYGVLFLTLFLGLLIYALLF